MTLLESLRASGTTTLHVMCWFASYHRHGRCTFIHQRDTIGAIAPTAIRNRCRADVSSYHTGKVMRGTESAARAISPDQPGGASPCETGSACAPWPR